MGFEIKVKIIEEEKIRPSSPTPHHLKTANLSVFDQLIPDVYVPLLLFYPNDDINLCHSLVAERLTLLKKSLSEALTQFYPFAGKFQYNDSICCNDHGAAFLEARVNCPMSRILETPDFEKLKQFLPVEGGYRQVDAYLLQVQANFFECGGIVIGVCISHKVADASVISKFVGTWAAIALGSASTTTPTDHVVLPAEFGTMASLFPPLDFLNTPQPAVQFDKEKWMTRRLVFDASKIAALKSKAATANVPNPTRVEVVSTLIWKCAFEASRSNTGSVRPSEWFQFLNMRNVLMQPSVQNAMGNFLGLYATEVKESDVNHDVQSLVAKLRKSVEEFKVKYAYDVSGKDACGFFREFVSLIQREDVDTYGCSSWCRFPFYSLNFGWGKPSWVAQITEVKDMIALMDTRDGDGIEALLTLDEENMAIFESNKELLTYAYVNPSVI